MKVAEQHEAGKLVQAAAQKARAEHNLVLSAVLQETSASHGRPLKIRRAIREAASKKPAQCLIGDEALAVWVAAYMTRHGYRIVKKIANQATDKNIPCL